jgi:bifunctional non-homologous end joining protein LigD
VEVAHHGWTSDGRLRQPVFRGVRADVDSADVRREG